MNDQSLIIQIVSENELLSPIELKQRMKSLQMAGKIPDHLYSFSVHVSQSTSGDHVVHYDVYPRFNNIIEVTL